MHRLTVLLASAIVIFPGATQVLAQESRPTLTVTRFEGKLKSSRTADAAADLADAIATRVEESGCCRVMLRGFLTQAKPGQSPPLSTVREAAVAGRVQYVIAGRATTTRTIRRPAAPSIATMLGQMRPGSSPSAAGAIGGPFAPRMPYPMPLRPQAVTMVTLEMRIIDAAGGQVLRTVTITRPASTDAITLVADSSQMSDALVHAISSIERARR
jgi:hypothetical protein